MNLHNVWTRIIPFAFVVLWSSGFIASKYAMPYAEPFTFLTIRFGIVALVLLIFSGLFSAAWPDRRLSLHAIVAGVLLHGGYLGPVFWAISRGMSSGISALIVSMLPILTGLLAPLLIGERVGSRQWAGLLLGALGVVLVLLPKALAGTADAHVETVVACILGLFGSTLGNIYQKRFATGIDLRTGGVLQFTGAGLAMLILAALTERWQITWNSQVVFSMLWSVFVMSIGAISLLMLMIRENAVARVAAYYFLVPPVTALMALAAFGETMNATQVAGMLLACVAVILVTTTRGDGGLTVPVEVSAAKPKMTANS